MSDARTQDSNGSTETSRTEPSVPSSRLTSELRDAVSPRTVGMVFGVLLLQLGFILSYVGAFHAPQPHRIAVAVVAPAQLADPLITRLNGLEGAPLDARGAATEQQARDLITRADVSAALLIDPSSNTDRLLVASGGGTSIAAAVENIAQQINSQQGRSLTVLDVVPLQRGDGRGLTGFYLVVGWIVGGYLVASLLGIAKGARPATTRRGGFRLAAIIPYAVVSGLGGAIVVDPVLGALTGHFIALASLGALLVAASAATTMALQTLFGTLGIGVTVLLFVVLGNPSAGGAYQGPLLPLFWRDLGPLLPTGAGTEAVRRLVYFDEGRIGENLAVIACYAVGGVAIALIATVRHNRAQQHLTSA